MISVTRYHDFSCAHRAVGDDGPCSNIHGHNYRVHFTVSIDDNPLNELGRVIDFSEIKTTIIDWIERNWDHRLLLWYEDPLSQYENALFPETWAKVLSHSIFYVPFNTSSENMAAYLRQQAQAMLGLKYKVTKVLLEETRKCSATSEY